VGVSVVRARGARAVGMVMLFLLVVAIVISVVAGAAVEA
jgi:hypothetical protein